MWKPRDDFVMTRTVHGAGLRREESGVTAIYRFLKDESGATAIEYGLIAALISIAVITGALAVGGSLGDLYTMVSSKVTGAIP